ncbi:hypothetical protein FRC11_014695, partial [Ceratobasidium sp. 423]
MADTSGASESLSDGSNASTHGVKRSTRIAQGSIVSLGTPSLLFHDRRAPRPQQVSRCGPTVLQIRAALFHASCPNQGLPFVWLAGLLK